MKTNIVTDISPLSSYLSNFCFWSYGPKYCCPIKLQVSLKCNISRKKRIMNFIFGMQIKIEVFYKLILSVQVCVARHIQSTLNKKFAYFCNSFKKRRERRLIFCLLISGKVFYKLIASLWVCVGYHSQSTQNNKFVISK